KNDKNNTYGHCLPNSDLSWYQSDNAKPRSAFEHFGANLLYGYLSDRFGLFLISAATPES
ncbi:MAG: hypothetical protein J6P20_07450, partial [Oscillospiraceae bacterium]|nr:hypothetical protein [Oscillospiraceae bacterium]